jgi:hypothetical protein
LYFSFIFSIFLFFMAWAKSLSLLYKKYVYYSQSIWTSIVKKILTQAEGQRAWNSFLRFSHSGPSTGTRRESGDKRSCEPTFRAFSRVERHSKKESLACQHFCLSSLLRGLADDIHRRVQPIYVLLCTTPSSHKRMMTGTLNWVRRFRSCFLDWRSLFLGK